ncbi:MAG: hypothetical protein V1909_03400 [Candidatus Micrarchaeota archaeon]
MVEAAQSKGVSIRLTRRKAGQTAQFPEKGEPEQIIKKENTELALRQRIYDLFRAVKGSSPDSKDAKKAIIELFTLGDKHDFLRRKTQDYLGMLELSTKGNLSIEAGRAYKALRDKEKYAPEEERLQVPRSVLINSIAAIEAHTPQVHDSDDFFAPQSATLNEKEQAHSMLRKTIELLEALPAFPLSSDLKSIWVILKNPNVMEQTGIRAEIEKLGESPRFHELAPLIIKAFFNLEDKASLEKLSKSTRALVSSLSLQALQELKKPKPATLSDSPQEVPKGNITSPEKIITQQTSTGNWLEDI